MIGSLHHFKAVAAVSLALACLGTTEVSAQTWTGSSPSEASDKTVYLYNVGAKKFLGKGGRWGTEANLNYEGVPFTLTYSSSKSTFTLKSQVKEQGSTSTSTGYLTITDGKNSTYDQGNFFVDRNDKVNNSTTVNNAFEPTAVTTADSKTAYTLTIKPTYSSSSTMYNTSYYMLGTVDNTVGCSESLDNTDASYGQWMIITEDERRKAFEAAEAANAKPVNATFLMYDFDFARNDNSVSYWKTGVDASSDLSYYTSALRLPSYAQGGTVTTYTHTYTSTHDAEYKRNSTTLEEQNTHTATFTITTRVPGDQMPQTITAECGGDTYTSSNKTYTHSSEEVTYNLTSTTETTSTGTAYTYYVGNGYADGYQADPTNTKEYTANNITYLFDAITGAQHTAEKNRQATFGGNWTANIHGVSGAVTQTLETKNMVRKGYYRVSCKAFTTSASGKVRLWAASGNNGNGSADEQDTNEKYAYTAITPITDAPVTYVAASELLQSDVTTYDASVKVYVENASTETLKFGIYVDGADVAAWTCFDDFAIEYLGDPQSTLVLDEDQTNGDYIKAQATKDDDELKTVKLYLHRSLNAGKWNSLVLPVSLNVGQVKGAFGDDVRISEFKGATDEAHPGRIIFQAINASRDNSAETAIEAGKLYLVKPSKEMPTGLTEVTVPTTDTKITSYYSIIGVTYARVADVKDMNYNAKVQGCIGDETYNSDTKVQFTGTYVKLGDDNKIPAYSYVLNGNNQGGTAGVWYYRTVETASKGFRGWLQTMEDESLAKQMEYSLDGEVYHVDGSTTGIQGIVDDLNARESNIYNLNGQLVRANANSRNGLAKGVYIQNGKKFIVK